jgi:hypothetical protein
VAAYSTATPEVHVRSTAAHRRAEAGHEQFGRDAEAIETLGKHYPFDAKAIMGG